MHSVCFCEAFRISGQGGAGGYCNVQFPLSSYLLCTYEYMWTMWVCLQLVKRKKIHEPSNNSRDKQICNRKGNAYLKKQTWNTAALTGTLWGKVDFFLFIPVNDHEEWELVARNKAQCRRQSPSLAPIGKRTGSLPFSEKLQTWSELPSIDVSFPPSVYQEKKNQSVWVSVVLAQVCSVLSLIGCREVISECTVTGEQSACMWWN